MQRNPRDLKDQDLLALAKNLCEKERRLQCAQIPVLCEIIRRRLYAKNGYDSLFTYLVKELKLAKACAYKRNAIAKASVRFPEILHMLNDGRYTISSAAMVAPHLTEANYQSLLTETSGKSIAELEIILAQFTQKTPAPDKIRVIGVVPPAPKPQSQADESPAKPCPGGFSFPPKGLSSERAVDPSDVLVNISFTTNKRVQDKLARVRDLMARKVREGGLSDVFEEVLDSYLQKHDPIEKAQRAANKEIRSPSAKTRSRFAREPVSHKHQRYIPAAIKHAVMKRDMGRCTFIGPNGQRCAATRYLEFDHIRPFALGGPSDDAGNIRLLCRAHNQIRAEAAFGFRHAAWDR